MPCPPEGDRAVDLDDPGGPDDLRDVVGLGRWPGEDGLVAGYRAGCFAMPTGLALDDAGRLTPLDGSGPAPPRGDELVAWTSPRVRGVLPLDGLHVSRSLRRSCRRYATTVDTAFGEVVDGCADRGGGGTWITAAYREAYRRLHARGLARSVEVRDADRLVGGLLVVTLGGLTCGESMFSRATDASKVALVTLVDLLGGPAGHRDGRLLDVQWATGHLESLGAVRIRRAEYLRRLDRALELAPAPGFVAAPGTPHGVVGGDRP